MIKAIFFDVANTLLQKPALISNIQSILEENGHVIAAKEIQLAHQELTETVVFPDKTSKQFYDHFNADLCRTLGIEITSNIIDTIYTQNRGLDWEPFSDTSYLDTISLPMGIGSNWDVTLRVKLDHFFNVRFKWVLVSEEVGVKKPDVSFFSRMIEMSGYESNEIMFVGDSMKLDIVPAIQLGIDAVLIDRTNFYASYDGKKVSMLNEISKWL